MFAWGVQALEEHFGGRTFELRYDLFGRDAVRVAGGGVLPRHVEAAPTAPWTAHARCGTAAGWLLAAAPPAEEARVRAWLDTVVARRTAFLRERQARALGALGAELIERLTHRLRTDVMTLSTVTEGALEGLFADEPADVLGEIRSTSAEAQRRITVAREVMTVLAAGADAAPEPIAETLRAELEGAGRAASVGVGDEAPWTRIGGAGWAACARALAADPRWVGFTVAPDEGGWRVTADGGAGAAAEAVAWSDVALGELTPVGHIVVAAGGHAAAQRDGDGRLRVDLIVPGAPGSG